MSLECTRRFNRVLINDGKRRKRSTKKRTSQRKWYYSLQKLEVYNFTTKLQRNDDLNTRKETKR